VQCFPYKMLTYSNKVITSIINYFFFLHEKIKKCTHVPATPPPPLMPRLVADQPQCRLRARQPSSPASLPGLRLCSRYVTSSAFAARAKFVSFPYSTKIWCVFFIILLTSFSAQFLLKFVAKQIKQTYIWYL
jgi:hypothetical protein